MVSLTAPCSRYISSVSDDLEDAIKTRIPLARTVRNLSVMSSASVKDSSGRVTNTYWAPSNNRVGGTEKQTVTERNDQ